MLSLINNFDKLENIKSKLDTSEKLDLSITGNLLFDGDAKISTLFPSISEFNFA